VWDFVRRYPGCTRREIAKGLDELAWVRTQDCLVAPLRHLERGRRIRIEGLGKFRYYPTKTDTFQIDSLQAQRLVDEGKIESRVCRGVKNNGAPCGTPPLFVGDDGYCKWHRPLAERVALSKRATDEQGMRCGECGTTVTSQWRFKTADFGPLCNACGCRRIRQKVKDEQEDATVVAVDEIQVSHNDNFQTVHTTDDAWSVFTRVNNNNDLVIRVSAQNSNALGDLATTHYALVDAVTAFINGEITMNDLKRAIE